MDNGHGGGKYGKWEVSLRVPDPMEPGLLEQPVREEGGAEGLPAALWGAESGAGCRRLPYSTDSYFHILIFVFVS